MDLTFVPKEESGWRGRGAARSDVPPQVLEMLKRTGNGQVGVIDTTKESPEEVAELIKGLRAGARHLKRNVRIQQDDDRSEVRFELVPRSET